MTEQVTCNQCRFWKRHYDGAREGSCLLANGDSNLENHSFPKFHVRTEEWGGREATNMGSSASSVLVTDQEFYCYHAEPGE